jgi:pimeloyl-ACP methyl ester carboxylesterase
MKNLRTHGTPPFAIAVLHGGPGAGGEMAPVARVLSPSLGILEPIQTATSIDGQVEELKTVLETHAALPVTLIGYSWGAWLGFIVAARYPQLVKKLILVGSGPFEATYAETIQERRLSRLSEDEREEVEALTKVLNDPESEVRDSTFARFGALFAKADAFDPIESESSETIEFRSDIFQSVWPEADRLRRSGELLRLAKDIRCPVTAIHGDHDPHPAEGVEKPLSRVLDDFKLILLERCGHTPWEERWARDEFFGVLRDELRVE